MGIMVLQNTKVIQDFRYQLYESCTRIPKASK